VIVLLYFILFIYLFIFQREKNKKLIELLHTEHSAYKTMFNPFTSPACKTSGLKSAHIHASKQYIFRSITNLISILCVLMKILSHANAKKRKKLDDFKFRTFIVRFQVTSWQ